jgi:UPF0271 protein
MHYILDTSFFFGNYPFYEGFMTTPEVVAELKDVISRMRFDVMQNQGLSVCKADAITTDHVRKTAKKSGDLGVLSETDISVIALGLFFSGTVVSDDFAVQNVCCHLKIPVQNMMQKKARLRVWKNICSGCGMEISVDEENCSICGSTSVKRGIKKRK